MKVHLKKEIKKERKDLNTSHQHHKKLEIKQ